jgi:hypothetical protein
MSEKYSKSITAPVLALLLAGCAGPRVTALDVEIAKAQAEAQKACYAAHQAPDYADARDAALVAMARALTGDPCKTTNVYEARAQIAAAQNQAAGRIVGQIATAGIAGVGIVAGADVLKTAVRGAGVHFAGDNNVLSKADGAASTTGPDLSTTTTTSQHYTWEAAQ